MSNTIKTVLKRKAEAGYDVMFPVTNNAYSVLFNEDDNAGYGVGGYIYKSGYANFDVIKNTLASDNVVDAINEINSKMSRVGRRQYGKNTSIVNDYTQSYNSNSILRKIYYRPENGLYYKIMTNTETKYTNIYFSVDGMEWYLFKSVPYIILDVVHFLDETIYAVATPTRVDYVYNFAIYKNTSTTYDCFDKEHRTALFSDSSLKLNLSSMFDKNVGYGIGFYMDSDDKTTFAWVANCLNSNSSNFFRGKIIGYIYNSDSGYNGTKMIEVDNMTVPGEDGTVYGNIKIQNVNYGHYIIYSSDRLDAYEWGYSSIDNGKETNYHYTAKAFYSIGMSETNGVKELSTYSLNNMVNSMKLVNLFKCKSSIYFIGFISDAYEYSDDLTNINNMHMVGESYVFNSYSQPLAFYNAQTTGYSDMVEGYAHVFDFKMIKCSNGYISTGLRESNLVSVSDSPNLLYIKPVIPNIYTWWGHFENEFVEGEYNYAQDIQYVKPNNSTNNITFDNNWAVNDMDYISLQNGSNILYIYNHKKRLEHCINIII